MKGVPFDGTYQIFFLRGCPFLLRASYARKGAGREGEREKNSQWTNFNRAIWCHEREKLLQTYDVNVRDHCRFTFYILHLHLT